ncbi:MAG: HAMP domain-containing protein [Desulfomonile tiedjei]|nr:HAMP domain-containing protein [Desulfomonile tiedjei]
MRKLRNKFLVYILLPVIVIISLAGILSFVIARQIVLQQMTELATLGLQQAADEIDSGLSVGIQTLKVSSMEAGMVDFTDAQYRHLFLQIASQFPVECAFVAFPDGRFISGLEQREIPQGYEPRLLPWYQAALDSDDTVVSASYLSPFSSELVMTVAQKVADPSGEVKGVLGFNVPLSTIRQKLPRIKILEKHRGTVFSIFRRDGRYIIHSSEEKIGHKLGESSADLHVRMRQALGADQNRWSSVGTVDEAFWYGGFQKTRQGDLFVGLEVPLAEAVAPILKLAWAYLGLGLASILVLSVVLVKMAHKIARPINMLSEAASRLSRGNYEQVLPVISRDELGHLVEAFNTMAAGLRQRDFIRDTFGRYLTQDVVDQLLEAEDGLKLGGENREISILISDVRGFTALTAEMPAEAVLRLLNRYLGKMVEILLDHGGTVDEIEGDGILAFFGAPTPMEDHPARAIACAIEMQAAMDHINAMNQADGLPRLEMGIAVNTGSVVVGNIGSERRTKYGIVGSEVNFAGRIESYAVGGEVLVSNSAFDRVREIAQLRDVIRVRMKGIRESVSLYSLRAMAGPYNVQLPDTVDVPVRVEEKIPFRMCRIDENIVRPVEGLVWITHLSENSAVILAPKAILVREEIRMELMEDSHDGSPSELFAKVLTVAEASEQHEATVRFTFVSPGLRRLFRSALRAPTP